jgi:hypothetical protein
MSVRRRKVRNRVAAKKTLTRQVGEFRKGLQDAHDKIEQMELARMRARLASIERENDELRNRNR